VLHASVNLSILNYLLIFFRTYLYLGLAKLTGKGESREYESMV